MKKVLILLLCLFTTESFASGIGNVATAPCDNDTLSKYTGTANVEINWEPNVIQLGWYDGNTKLDVPASAQSCTYDGVVTVPPQPTKLGYTFNGWKVMGVPTGYTKLEYIESTGTQCIDTGIVPTLDYSIEVKAEKDVAYSLFGCPGYYYNLTGNHGRHYFYLGNYGNGRQIYFPTNVIDDTVPHIWGFDAQREMVYCDDITVTANDKTNTPTKHLYLFARMGDCSDGGNNKIYWAKLWDESNRLIFHGIPVRRNSDNVLGMWDSISGNFFTNIGTGTFTAGPVVQ